MQPDSLSQNGIQRVINNCPSIVQITDFHIKQKGESKFFIVQISDGYAKLKKCVIMDDVTRKQKPKLYDVISTELTSANMKQGKPVHVMIQNFNILRDDVSRVIGEPIFWNQFQKSKKNPKGDNMIPPRANKKGNMNNKNGKAINMDSIFEDDNSQNNDNNTRSNVLLKKPQQQQKPNPQASHINMNSNNSSNFPTNNRKVSQMQSTQSITTSKPLANNSRNQSIKNQTNNTNNTNKNQPNFANKNPPQQQKQQQPSQSRYDHNYTLIKQLYEGIQNFKLKVRIIFINQLKNYIKKANGQQSQVFSFQGCDQHDCIEFTVFGDSAGNLSNMIELDGVFQIAGGKVSKDDYAGKLRIMLNERSVVNLLQDDPAIPEVDDYCITPQILMQKDVGSEWNVIALIKDSNQIIEFVSKNGKPCKKKDIYLCDPISKVQIPVTLWFQKVHIKFERVPYALQGITIQSFKDEKQYSTSLKFNFRQCKRHNFKKFINTYENMQFQNPVHTFTSKPVNLSISNFHSLRLQAQKLELNKIITLQKICYLTQISLTSKNTYLSCPLCKRKVMDQENGMCMSDKCGKAYSKGKYRYLLNVGIADETETIWGTAYDEAAQVMLTSRIDGSVLTADEFVRIDQEDMKLKVPGFLQRQMKIMVTAKKDSYNGMEKIKYSFNKASIHIDYEKDFSNLTKQIDHILSLRKRN